MNLNRIYNNPNLEARRLALLKRLQAEEVLRESHEASGSLLQQIELGFHSFNKRKKTRLAQWIAESAQPLNPKDRDSFRTLLLAMEEKRASILEERRHIGAMSRLARFSSRWVRAPAGYSARTYNPDRLFGDVARFLLARWPVPKFFDNAWSERSTDTHREWFIHIGSGGNLRTAAGLPFALTKMMSHHALLAPDNTPIVSALRWGQVRALGGSERLASAVINSLLRDAQYDEPFWLTVVQFFVANPMLDPYQVGPIVDWINNQRFVPEPRRIVNGVVCGGEIRQPGLNMKGRTVECILRQVERWHGDLNRATVESSTTWPTCGIPGYERMEGTEGSQTIVRIQEIVASADLREEGRAMRHCVASYSRTCARGASAIFSLARDDGMGYERRLTIQIDVSSKRIIQARGRFNAPPRPLDERYLRNWATATGLSIACF
jgi:hypothetical protein